MDKLRGRAWWGIILIVLGILFLLQEFQVVGSAFQYLWMIIFAAAGVYFGWLYISSRAQWWAVIPASALIGLSLVMVEDVFVLFPGLDLGGPLFLGSLGAGFWLVYARRREHWWALIPGGVLLTLALVAGLEDIGYDSGGAIFFLGLGLTFILVAILPSEKLDTRWSLIPAAVMILLGLSQLSRIGEVLFTYWPGLLILVGAYILIQAWRNK